MARTALLITGVIERLQHLLAELRRFIDDRGAITYGELDRRSNRLANLLVDIVYVRLDPRVRTH